MAKRKRSKARRDSTALPESEAAPTAGARAKLAETKKRMNEKTEALLGEIDRILEHGDTAANYVQMGGE